MYQTMEIFQKSSGFLEWQTISSNSERCVVLITLKQYQKAFTRDSKMYSQSKNYPI